MVSNSLRGTGATYDKEVLLEEFRKATREARASNSQSPTKTKHSPPETIKHCSREWSEQVWNWLSRPNHEDAVAPCLVAEVMDLEEVAPKNKSTPYYRLGRVPCMHARLVGMLVGFVPYEKRAIYYVDDGTAVIECIVIYEARNGFDVDLPPPVAREGSYVRVTGKVGQQHGGKILNNASIERCGSEADVLAHRRLVKTLYAHRYEDHSPFKIPEHAPAPPPVPAPPIQTRGRMKDIFEQLELEQREQDSRPVSPQQEAGPSTIFPRTPSKNRVRTHPASPALSEASAYTASAAGSPTKSARFSSSHKLRHPTRIRRQDTTTALFRTYLMHYIAHGPSRSATEDDQDDADVLDSDIFKTPTKRRPLADLTPRPNKRLHRSPSPSTPRAAPVKEPDTSQRGFTMSHLRRVPELALLANKLHRRLLEEHTSQSRHHTESPKVKIKRLFVQSLQELHKRGSIVIIGSDGLVHPLPERGQGWDLEDSRMWKASSSSTQAQGGGDLSRASTRSGRSRTQVPDVDDLSDPEDGEEAYVPCTARSLAAPVLEVLQRLAPPDAHKSRVRKRPTTSRITESLKNSDEKWARIGDLQVEEALHLLQAEWRVRKEAGGTWGVLDRTY